MGRQRGRSKQERIIQGQSPLLAVLRSCFSPHRLEPMRALSGNAPHFRPALVANSIAQGQHRIDVGALPTHPRPFQTSLDDQFVGAFHHARTNGPPLLAEVGIVHHSFALAEIAQVLTHPLLLGELLWQTIGQAQQRGGTTMFEDMQTPA